MIQPIPSDWLHAFASFAEDASLSRAAKRLHLSQPAVHAQLRRLSDALGVPLYQRAGRGLVLTKEGLLVAAFARDAEERTRDLVSRLHGESGERRVVLAAGAGALLHVLGEGLRAFSRAYDGRLDVVTADAAGALDAVGRGTAHVGVAALASDPESFETHQLTQVDQVLVVPRAHALARRRRATLEDLEGERLVLPPEGRPQRAVLDAALAARGVRVRTGALAVGWELTIRLVELGAGLAIVNGSVRLPRGVVGRPLRELPRVRYVAFTRVRPRDDATSLVRALVRHAHARGT